MNKDVIKDVIEWLDGADGLVEGLSPKKANALLICICEDAVNTLRGALAEQSAQQQEPVAWLWELTGEVTTDPDRADGIWLPLYTSPPAKPWVGLTDEEIAVIAAACGGLASDFVVDVARAIEQAHGITGETK